MKRFFALTALVITGGLVWLVWFKPAKEAEPEPQANVEVPVHAGKIVRATLRNYVAAYGSVEPEPNASARVVASVPGVIAESKCIEGQRVEKGSLLFQLDSRAADAAVDFAEKSLERQKKLGLGEGTSQKAMQEAEQQAAAARIQRALLNVVSPLAGVVTRVNAKPGEAADLTTVLAEVIDLDRLAVSATVPSAELAAIKPEQPVEVLADSTQVNGWVAFVNPQEDPKTGGATVRVRLSPQSELHPGQFVKIRIATEEHKNCLSAPIMSVAKNPQGLTQIALVENDNATLKDVKIGLKDADRVEIEADGLKPDLSIVTEEAYSLIMTGRPKTKIHVLSE